MARKGQELHRRLNFGVLHTDLTASVDCRWPLAFISFILIYGTSRHPHTYLARITPHDIPHINPSIQHYNA